MAELIADFLVEYVYYRLFYWPGWLILRVLTLGKYPPPQSESHNRIFVASIPLLVVLAAITVYYS